MLMTVAIIATATAQAQYVTYNHDSPKQNQITVMETGTGALYARTLLHAALHNKYKKSAASKEQTVVPHDWRVSISTIRQMKRKPSIRHLVEPCRKSRR